jgi:hypothetical protein
MRRTVADEVLYVEGGRAEWNSALADSVTVTVEPDESAPQYIVVKGTCPRCGHGFAHAESIFSYRALDRDDTLRPGIGSLLRSAIRRASAEPGSRNVFAYCNCRVPHPGSPEGVAGCGASWSLHIEWGV